MYESILVGELSERLRCVLRTAIWHNDLRYAMACEERLQLFDYRFRIGSLEFGQFEESRVIVDRNQVLRVMPVKQVCSNAFPWPLWNSSGISGSLWSGRFRWHFLHALIMSAIWLDMHGHQTFRRAVSLHLWMPKCPMCILSRISARSRLGITIRDPSGRSVSLHSVHRGLGRIRASLGSLSWLAANHARSMPSPEHIGDLLCTLVWFVSSWQWMPHCTAARTSSIPRTFRRHPQSPHRDGHSRSGLATVHQLCVDSSPEHMLCRTSISFALDGSAALARAVDPTYSVREVGSMACDRSLGVCTPMTYWANRSHAHVRARASFSTWAYRDSQSIIDRDAYATTFRLPLPSSCWRVVPSPQELASAGMIKGLVASYHANVGVVHSSFLMLSMAFHTTSLRSNSLSGLVKEVKLVGQICPSGSTCREIVVIPWHSVVPGTWISQRPSKDLQGFLPHQWWSPGTWCLSSRTRTCYSISCRFVGFFPSLHRLADRVPPW